MSGNATATTKVYAAFGYPPLSSAPVWTELNVIYGIRTTETFANRNIEAGDLRVLEGVWDAPAYRSRLRSARISRGRGSELDTFREGTCTMVLDNRDRALEPEYAASPYYPNVVPNVRVKIEATVSGTTTVVFDGYIDAIVPGYVFGANGGDAVVTVHCTDLTKFLGRFPMLSPYDLAVTADAPLHWWKMGEAPDQTVMHDAGSQTSDGTYTPAAALGQPPVAFGTAQTSLKVVGAPKPSATARFPTVPAPWTVECVVRNITPPNTGAIYSLYPVVFGSGAVVLIDSVLGLVFRKVTIDINLGIRPANGLASVGGAALLFSDDASTNTSAFVPGSAYVEGLPTAAPLHIAMTNTGSQVAFYVNGQLVVSHASTTPLPISDMAAPMSTIQEVAAQIGDVAVYASVLSAGAIAAHASAARAPWGGESTGARVGRLLSAAGVPGALWDVNGGATNSLGPQTEPVEGKYALDLARAAEVTERGRMFATAAGKWKFASRRSLDGLAPVAAFGDGGGAELPYVELVEEYDEKTIIRTATVKRQGGNPQTYTDPTAGTADAMFGVNVDGTLYGTDQEAFDAAAWVVVQNRKPKLRFRRVSVAGERSAVLMAQCAAREIGDVVTVKRRPPGGGSPQSKNVVVEGIEHDINLQAPSWHTTYMLSPVDPGPYWTLEDPVNGVLGSTTVLAF